MGRGVKGEAVLDVGLQGQISQICQQTNGSCGLVIGQVSEDGRFLIAHLIRSSLENESNKSSQTQSQVPEEEYKFVRVNQLGGDGNKENKEKEEGTLEEGEDCSWSWQLHSNFINNRHFAPFSTVKHITPARLPQLSRQVSRLLPGGLGVLGVFITSSEGLSKVDRGAVKTVLHDMAAQLRKDCASIYKGHTTQQMLILSFDPRSKKVNCGLYCEALDVKSIMKPLAGIHTAKLDFIQLQTRYQLNVERPLEHKKGVEGVLKDIVKQLEEMVGTSLCLFADEHRDKPQLLDANSQLPQPNHRNIHTIMLVPFDPIQYEEVANEEEKVGSGNGREAFSGDVVGRAYVQVGASLSFAIQAVKDDLLRSMTTRAELHCEDFLVTDADEQDFDVVHELPRRILVSLPNCNVKLSNYLSEREVGRDSLEVFVNLLDLPPTLTTSDLLLDLEKSPNQDALDSALESVSTHSGEVEAEVGEERSQSRTEQDAGSNAPSNRFQSLAALLAVMFGILFALYQVYLLYSTSDQKMSSSASVSGEL